MYWLERNRVSDEPAVLGCYIYINILINNITIKMMMAQDAGELRYSAGGVPGAGAVGPVG
jgi:hypothetical protein